MTERTWHYMQDTEEPPVTVKTVTFQGRDQAKVLQHIVIGAAEMLYDLGETLVEVTISIKRV